MPKGGRSVGSGRAGVSSASIRRGSSGGSTGRLRTMGSTQSGTIKHMPNIFDTTLFQPEAYEAGVHTIRGPSTPKPNIYVYGGRETYSNPIDKPPPPSEGISRVFTHRFESVNNYNRYKPKTVLIKDTLRARRDMVNGGNRFINDSFNPLPDRRKKSVPIKNYSVEFVN